MSLTYYDDDSIIQGSLELATDATVEPVSTEEARKHLNITHTDDDAYIDVAIAAAVRWAQKYTSRQFINATYKLRLLGFPREIRLPKPPLSSVTSITYIDTDGTSQTLASTVYQTDQYTEPARICEAYGQSWPSTRPDIYNAVTVTYVAGYGSTGSTVPAPIRQAILAFVHTNYEQRGNVVTGLSVERIPEVGEHLLYPYRVIQL